VVGQNVPPAYRQLLAPLRFCANLRIRHAQDREPERLAEAITLIDETIRLVEATGELTHMAELLRVKGKVLLSMGRPSGDAEMCFTQSLELCRRQGARAWELRTATDLAALWASLGGHDEARALLLPIFEQFTEGADTADLKGAQRLLATL
jgi:predicted ATPase